MYWSIVGGLDLEQWLDCLTRLAVDGVNFPSSKVLLAYDNADESDAGLGNATLDHCKLQMSFPELRLPSGDGCDIERAHSMSRCWRARTHVDAMGKWIEFELHLHGSPKHCNSPR